MGGVIYIENIDNIYGKMTLIKSSVFSNNSAQNMGGSIFIYNQLTEFYNVSFYENSAVYGGAIYNDKNYNGEIILRNCSFENNLAFLEGAALKYNDKPPKIENSSFRNNNAPYGNDFGSYPVRIKFQIINQTNGRKIWKIGFLLIFKVSEIIFDSSGNKSLFCLPDIASGQEILLSFKLTLIDENNQEVISISERLRETIILIKNIF